MTVYDAVDGPGLENGRAIGGYFNRVTCTDDWQELEFGNVVLMNIHILNESANAADLSWDKTGTLPAAGPKDKQGEIGNSEILIFERRPTKKMYVKNTVAGNAAVLRIMAW